MVLCFREIKSKYNHSLEEADSTPQGWFQVQNLLERYYARHNVSKTPHNIKEMMFWTRKKGLAKLDEKLKGAYNESLSEFEARNGKLHVVFVSCNWHCELTATCV